MVKLKFEGQKQEFLTDIVNIELINKPTETPLTKERLLNCGFELTNHTSIEEEKYSVFRIDASKYFIEVWWDYQTFHLRIDDFDSHILPIPFTEEALNAQYKLFTGEELNFDNKIWKNVVEFNEVRKEIEIKQKDGFYCIKIDGRELDYRTSGIASSIIQVLQNLKGFNNEEIFAQFGFK